MSAQIGMYLSYLLKLRGPNRSVDTACSSTMYGLEQAFKDIRTGKCDQAIVCGVHVTLEPRISVQFKRLGVLNPDGLCKCFDDKSDGYTRSEAVVSIFMQKSKSAKRIYATMVHGLTNCDGFKFEGINFPSAEGQTLLLEDFYRECGISPNELGYMEAHSTGTHAGDPEEIKAIEKVLCARRDTPLLIGSIKSHIGHTEPVALLCSLVKVLYALNSGVIPQNVNFTEPRKDIPALMEGKVKVVTKPTLWPHTKDYAAISAFGFGGANGHTLMKRHNKVKTTSNANKLPILICLSGRTEETVETIQNDIRSTPRDTEYYSLYHQIFKKQIPKHPYKGYMILDGMGETFRTCQYLNEELESFVCFFASRDKSWASKTLPLLEIPILNESIKNFQNILHKNGTEYNIFAILNQYNPENLTHYILGTVAIQMGIVDVLKSLRVKLEYSGSSLGAIPSFYAQKLISFEDAVLASCSLNEACLDQSVRPNGTIDSLIEQKLLEQFEKSKSMESKQGVVGSATSPQQLRDIFRQNENFGKTCANYVVEFGAADAAETLLNLLGCLYLNGQDVPLEVVYPPNFPVSRGTPMIAHLMTWNHEVDLYPLRNIMKVTNHSCKNYTVDISSDIWCTATGHVIDGRNLFPATGHIYMVWDVYSEALGKRMDNCRVLFENVRFVKASTVPQEEYVIYNISVQKMSGFFSVALNGDTVAYGTIKECDEEEFLDIPKPTEESKQTPLDTNDVYKELRLRGYHYKDAYKSIKRCENPPTSALIEWKNDYIVFMDNMLQLKILQLDSRNLYVPTGINRLVIDPSGFRNHISSLDDNAVAVCVNNQADTITAPFIEISGISAAPIPRRKTLENLVTEKYVFVPNEITCSSLETSLQIMINTMQTVNFTVKTKIVEVVEGDKEICAPIIEKIFSKLPLLQNNVVVFSDKKLEINGITAEDKKLSEERGCYIAIVNNASENCQIFREAQAAVIENGFILSRELPGSSCKFNEEWSILSKHDLGSELLVLLRRRQTFGDTTVIRIEDDSFEWVDTVKHALNESKDIIFYTRNEPINGLVGFVLCLKREDGHKVRIVSVEGDVPDFDIRDDFYAQQLQTGHVMNIFKNNQWGTFSHIALDNNAPVENEHNYVVIENPGDFSSAKWVEGSLKRDKVKENEVWVDIEYSSLNFRDVMTGSGRLSIDVITQDRTQQHCVQGFEFSGRTTRGRNVFGLVTSGALATAIVADPQMLWDIPENWTMEDAATVPCVYGTVLYALIHIGKLQPNNSILVHSATGGVGQAALNIASYMGCEIFCTVGSQEKKEYILNNYPNIKAAHIGNSRSTLFEQLVMQQTKGLGVDIILNSLAEEKLQASVRCLAFRGKFLEIGKFDLANDHTLPMSVFDREIGYHGIMLDYFMSAPPQHKKLLQNLLEDGIKNGSIKPLPRTTFQKKEVEKAFKFMASGKHMGKVLLKIRGEDNLDYLNCQPRYYCDPDKTVIIVGGLGGFGLELADWLVLRSCRKLILNTTHGVINGYQASRIRIWESYGVKVIISRHDLALRKGCVQMFEEAAQIGTVQAVFNLAVVLRDGAFQNLGIGDFEESYRSKGRTTKNLDEVSRQLCPELRDFVVFSSMSCGRGNAGQTNYGYSNSVMERICEERKKDGFPALAVQWGVVGDVGLLANRFTKGDDIVVSGTHTQKITSCLSTLDGFLRQDETVVSSMVVATKMSSNLNPLQAIAQIIGLRDISLVSSSMTLPELGMDSITIVEVRQILEDTFDISLTPQQLKSMTIAQIQGLQNNSKDVHMKTSVKETGNSSFLDMFVKGFSQIKFTEESVIQIPKSNNKHDNVNPIITIPGLDGVINSIEYLASNLRSPALCCQSHNFDDQTVRGLAESYLPVIEQNLKERTFKIVAYSYGCTIALELIALLEANGYEGKAVFIDGAAHMIKKLLKTLPYLDGPELELAIMHSVLKSSHDEETADKAMVRLLAVESEEKRNKIFSDYYENDQNSNGFKKLLERIRHAAVYEKTFEKVKASIILIRPKNILIALDEEDYRLSECCENFVGVRFVDGDHSSIKEDPAVMNIVNDFFSH